MSPTLKVTYCAIAIQIYASDVKYEELFADLGKYKNGH